MYPLLQLAQKNRFFSFIYRIVKGYLDNNIGKTSAAMTYYIVFAMFPFFIFVTSLLGLLELPPLTVNDEIARFLPEDIVAFLNVAISHITNRSNNALLTFGLVFSVWFPYRAVSHLMEAVNDIYDGYHIQKRVSVTKKFFVAILLVVLIPAMVLLLIIGERVLLLVSNYVPLSLSFIQQWTTLRFLPLAAALLFVLSMVYFLSPTYQQPVRYIVPGAMVSMVSWMIFSLIFSYYVDHVGSYSVVYGSIGAVIALLVFLNTSMTTMLMGAVFNVALKK